MVSPGIDFDDDRTSLRERSNCIHTVPYLRRFAKSGLEEKAILQI